MKQACSGKTNLHVVLMLYYYIYYIYIYFHKINCKLSLRKSVEIQTEDIVIKKTKNSSQLMESGMMNKPNICCKSFTDSEFISGLCKVCQAKPVRSHRAQLHYDSYTAGNFSQMLHVFNKMREIQFVLLRLQT